MELIKDSEEVSLSEFEVFPSPNLSLIKFLIERIIGICLEGK